MRYDPTTHLMQSIDRHNKKIEELTRRVKELEKLLTPVNEISEIVKRGPGRPRKDAQ